MQKGKGSEFARTTGEGQTPLTYVTRHSYRKPTGYSELLFLYLCDRQYFSAAKCCTIWTHKHTCMCDDLSHLQQITITIRSIQTDVIIVTGFATMHTVQAQCQDQSATQCARTLSDSSACRTYLDLTRCSRSLIRSCMCTNLLRQPPSSLNTASITFFRLQQQQCIFVNILLNECTHFCKNH